MGSHDESRTAASHAGGSTSGEPRRDQAEKADTIAKAGASCRETLAGSAAGFGGGGPDSAGVYTSAEREEGMGVKELLNAGQEEVFSRTEVEGARIEHHVGEKPGTRPVTRR